MIAMFGPIAHVIGIYACFCKVTGKCYVGSALDVWVRVRGHCYQLTTQTHHNPYFQRAWNKYGEDNFEWVVLEICGTEEELRDREQHWINFYRKDDHKRIYNIANPVRQRVPAFRMSEAHKTYWQNLTEEDYQKRIAHFDDPDFKRRLSELRNDPESVRAVSEKAKTRWVNDEFYAITVAKMEAFWADDDKSADARQARSDAAAKLWATKAHRSAMSEKRAQRWQDPTYAAERKQGTTDLWTDPEYRAKTTASVKAGCNTPEYIAALRLRTKQQHARARAGKRERLAALSTRLSAVAPV